MVLSTRFNKLTEIVIPMVLAKDQEALIFYSGGISLCTCMLYKI